MFLNLKVYFVEIVDLEGLTCPIADNVGYSNYVITYVDNSIGL